MGNLGFQAIYHLLNAQPGLVCERAFLPTREEWQEHRRTRTSVLTLESQRPLTDFAAVAFSWDSITLQPSFPSLHRAGCARRILAATGRPITTKNEILRWGRYLRITCEGVFR